MANQIFVLNTVAASAADLSRLGASRVKVTGDTQGFLRKHVESIKVKPFVVETLADIDVTATASPAANTTYRFLIEQEDAYTGGKKYYPVEYYAQAGVTATILGNALAALVQSHIDKSGLEATATAITSGNGGVTVAGVAGSAVVAVVQPINMTVASGWAVVNATSTDFAAVAATGVVTVEVASTSGLVVGQLHNITWTGSETINGKAGTTGTILRVSAILSGPARVQYIAETISADITGADGTLQRVASEEEGAGADIIAERGITGGGSPNVDIVSTNVYHEVIVKGGEPSGNSLSVENFSPFEKHYFISSTASAANALTLLTQFEYVEQYLDSAGTAVDPLLL